MNWDSLARLAGRATSRHLGREVAYVPAGGVSETISNAIWYEAEEREYISDGVPVIAPVTSVSFLLSDLSQTPAVGDAVTVDSVSYRIAEVKDDGLGSVWCRVLR